MSVIRTGFTFSIWEVDAMFNSIQFIKIYKFEPCNATHGVALFILVERVTSAIATSAQFTSACFRAYNIVHCYSVFARDVTDLSSAMVEVQRTNMAAAHTEHPSQNGLELRVIYEIPLSNHAKSLECIVKKRCVDKYIVLVFILFLFRTKS